MLTQLNYNLIGATLGGPYMDVMAPVSFPALFPTTYLTLLRLFFGGPPFSVCQKRRLFGKAVGLSQHGQLRESSMPLEETKNQVAPR